MPRKTTYLFNLKNTLINKVFLWFVRKKLNKATYNLILRGRHPNRKELFKQIETMIMHPSSKFPWFYMDSVNGKGYYID